MTDTVKRSSRFRGIMNHPDALFFVLFAALGAALTAALWSGPLLPWRDLPDHLALISLLDHARVPGSVAADHYTIQLTPVPYWIFYGSVWLFARVMSWTAAAQMVATMGLLLTPLALGRLLGTLGRDRRWGLLALPLFFNHNLMYGWLSYCLGIAVLLMALAALIERIEGRGSARALGLWACLLFLAHAQLAALFALFTAYLVMRPNEVARRARLLTVLAPLAAPLLLALPWVISRLLGVHGRGEVSDGPALLFHAPVTRLKRLPDFLTNCWPGSADDWMGLATIAAIALLIRTGRSQAPATRASDHKLGSGLVLICAALYFLAPWEVRWPTNQWAIYNRFAILTLILAPCLIQVPFPQRLGLPHKAPALWIVLLWCLPTLNFAQRNKEIYTSFNQRNAPILRAVEMMLPNQRILPLVQNASDVASHLGAADQFHAYYVIEHGGYDPYLFDNPSHPVIHRAAVKPIVPPWNQPRRSAALRALSTWGKAAAGKARPFTYVIEQGRGETKPALGPLFNAPQFHGRWTIHQRKTP